MEDSHDASTIDAASSTPTTTRVRRPSGADYEALGEQLAGAASTSTRSRTRSRLSAWPSPPGASAPAAPASPAFPGPGEPRNIFDKLDDCAVIQQLTRATPTVSLHIPWDKADDRAGSRQTATRSASASTR